MSQSWALVLAAIISAASAVLVATLSQIGQRTERDLMEKEVAALKQAKEVLPTGHQALVDLTTVIGNRAARWASWDGSYRTFERRLRWRLLVVYVLSFAAAFFSLARAGVISLVLVALALLVVVSTLERVLRVFFGRPPVVESWWKEFL